MISKIGKTYVYLANEKLGKEFLMQAEKEGFTFADGTKPTERHWSDIIAVNNDMTINYVGFVGHMAFRYASVVGDKPLLKIDYREVVN